MSLEQKKLDKVAQEVSNIINRLAQDDPTWIRFLTTSPAFRFYYHRGHRNNGDRYFWTTDALQHTGKKRFASGIYKYLKSKRAYKLTNARYHAKRSDAKARALKLWEANQPDSS